MALVAFRVPSEPCFTGRGKSAGLLPGALRAASDENMDRAPAKLCKLWVLVDIACLCCVQQCGCNDSADVQAILLGNVPVMLQPCPCLLTKLSSVSLCLSKTITRHLSCSATRIGDLCAAGHLPFEVDVALPRLHTCNWTSYSNEHGTSMCKTSILPGTISMKASGSRQGSCCA